MHLNFIDFINLLLEESSYHIINIGILVIFSFYGSYKTIKKRIDLEIFRYKEQYKDKLDDNTKKIIKKKEKKLFLKEFCKSFFALFFIYSIYIIYRLKIFI